MAKSTAMTRPIVVMAAPKRRSGGFRRAARRAGGAAKRGSVALARKAFEEKFAITGIVAAAAVGYAEASGKLDFLPDVGPDPVTTLGLGLFLFGKRLHPKARGAGVALLCAKAYQWGGSKGHK